MTPYWFREAGIGYRSTLPSICTQSQLIIEESLRKYASIYQGLLLSHLPPVIGVLAFRQTAIQLINPNLYIFSLPYLDLLAKVHSWQSCGIFPSQTSQLLEPWVGTYQGENPGQFSYTLIQILSSTGYKRIGVSASWGYTQVIHVW